MNDTQQLKIASSPAREIAERHIHKTPAFTPLIQTNAGHIITKITRKNSIEYFCKNCNTNYSRKIWIKEDHPGIDERTFTKFVVKEFY